MMANPSISIEDDVLDDFDEVIWELEKQGELPRKTARSAVIQKLMEDYIDEHQHLLEDEENRSPAVPVAN